MSSHCTTLFLYTRINQCLETDNSTVEVWNWKKMSVIMYNGYKEWTVWKVFWDNFNSSHKKSIQNMKKSVLRLLFYGTGAHHLHHAFLLSVLSWHQPLATSCQATSWRWCGWELPNSVFSQITSSHRWPSPSGSTGGNWSRAALLPSTFLKSSYWPSPSFYSCELFIFSSNYFRTKLCG